jgi:hypothetical protein
MADYVPPARYKIADTDEPFQDGYHEWKRAKILLALEESCDVEKLMTAEEVWKKLGFED